MKNLPRNEVPNVLNGVAVGKNGGDGTSDHATIVADEHLWECSTEELSAMSKSHEQFLDLRIGLRLTKTL